jgi:hypothetical protein
LHVFFVIIFPLKITLGVYQSQGAPPLSTTPVANLAPVSMKPAANFATGLAGVVDTGGKFCHLCQQYPVNGTCGK